jgi:hypothetical protein
LLTAVGREAPAGNFAEISFEVNSPHHVFSSKNMTAISLGDSIGEIWRYRFFSPIRYVPRRT